MADQSDVETTLVGLIVAALYPAGTSGPSAVGTLARVYRGWPTAAALDADLLAGFINVSVFPVDGGGHTTTRYPETWYPIVAQAPTLTATLSGTTATFGGAGGAGQVAGLMVDGRTYVYRTTSGDTPASVAANLATLARADAIVGLTGASISVPGAGRMLARVVADTGAVQEVRRQVRDFRVSCWCSTPALRDQAAATIYRALAPLHFIALPDGSAGRLTYAGGNVFDQSQNATLYRRDLVYSVEYPTMLSALLPAMLFGSGTLDAVPFIG